VDEKFLEFWGNLLISAAHEKKRMDDISGLMKKSTSDFNEMLVSGFGTMSSMFRKLYGLDKLPERQAESGSLAEKAVDEFQRSFKDYLSLMGIFPREEYLALVEKYEKLKEKCAEQEETIKHLKLLLGAKTVDQGDAIKSLQDIARNQSELFHNMMKDFSQYLNKDEPKDQEEPGPKEDEAEQIINHKGDE
jgi:hypothetical protein